MVAPALVTLATSCSDDNGFGAKPPGPPSGSTGAGGSGGPCADGESASCHVTIGEEGGILTCLDGTKVCVAGEWGPCEGSFTAQPMPKKSPGGRGAPGGSDEYPSPLSLSTPVSCMSNPCDPSCQVFDEVPPGGVVAPPPGTFGAGEISTIPPGALDEPCDSGSDCQFDHACNLPASGTCAHSKCVSGGALELGCDPCVDDICATNPACCTTPTGTCSHDICQPGDALALGCDACVDTICGLDPTCCADPPFDTPACAHQACSPGDALDAACDPCVASICALDASCCAPSFAAGCAHDGCTTGAALAAGCDTCVAAVCTANEGCCGTDSTFDPSCAAAPGGHDPCVPGKALSGACDTCVADICADPLYASCCSGAGNAWTSACVDAVNEKCAPKSCDDGWTDHCVDLVGAMPACGGASCDAQWTQGCADQVNPICGGTCTGGGWTATCVTAVATECAQTCGTWDATCVGEVSDTCGAYCEPLGDPDAGCAHDPCFAGPALAAACSTCVTDICLADPSCCATDWTEACADMVGSVCGQTCTEGDCSPLATDTIDPACAGQPDLTVGVPCDDTIPVCNHGVADLPAGAVLFLYPAGSPHFGSASPPNDGSSVGTCALPAVPAGTCVNVDGADCGGALGGPLTVMANPPLGAGNAAVVTECRADNNWSEYYGGTCDVMPLPGYGPGTYSQIYESLCDVGETAQWGFFSWHSTTPGDSSLQFEVHTSYDIPGLGPPLLDAGIAQAMPDTQDCDIATGGTCPVNLYDLFGPLDARKPVLELVVTLTPTSDGTQTPTLEDWQITYSCIESE
ncbi:MAG: hypothetical protein WKG00_07650 [Polyangiaceae bacterium]